MVKNSGPGDKAKLSAPRFVKKGQLPVNEKKQKIAIKDRVAFRKYQGAKNHGAIESLQTTNIRVDPVTGEKIAQKTVDKKEKKNIKLNPYHKEIKAAEQAKLAKEAEIERKKAEIAAKNSKNQENLEIRQRSAKKLNMRTPRGQPVMKNVVKHLFDKIKTKQSKGLL